MAHRVDAIPLSLGTTTLDTRSGAIPVGVDVRNVGAVPTPHVLLRVDTTAAAVQRIFHVVAEGADVAAYSDEALVGHTRMVSGSAWSVFDGNEV